MKIELDLYKTAVLKIEKETDMDLKHLLEKEINENVEAFIERLGYNNF